MDKEIQSTSGIKKNLKVKVCSECHRPFLTDEDIRRRLRKGLQAFLQIGPSSPNLSELCPEFSVDNTDQLDETESM